MAQIQIFPGTISTEGANRLLSALQDEIASGRDLGPRGTQIRALGHSLEQASHELRRRIKRISITSSRNDPDFVAASDDVRRASDILLQLAETCAQLGMAARAYPT
jgi:hypothetical protein